MKAWIAIAIVAGLGCGKKDGAAGGGSASATATDAVPKTAAEVVAALGAAKYSGPGLAVAVTPLPEVTVPGPAYVWVAKVGLVAIDGGEAKLTKFPEDTSVAALAVDKDGSLVGAGLKVLRIRGDKVEEIGTGGPGASDRVAIAPDGTIWVVNYEGLWRFAKGAWEKQPLDFTGEPVLSIDFDGAGHVFLTNQKRSWVLDGGAWKSLVDTRAIKGTDTLNEPLWQQAIVAPNGELWLIGCQYLVRVAKGGAVTASALPAPYFAHGVASGGAIKGNACDYQHSVAQLAADGTATAKEIKTTESFGQHSTVDGRGRVWGGVYGVVVANPDGTATTYPAGAIPVISGDIVAFAVAGTGPDKLPAVAEVAMGTISGGVLDHGKPVAGAPVEMCGYPTPKFDKTPCEYSRDRIIGKTDDKGVFHIEGPLKSWRVAVKVGESWYTLKGKECTGLAPGAECLWGVMEVSSSPAAPP